MSLARAERVRSALAVPLMSQDQVVGVLEVWRRKPSTFTAQHTAELATLANLASLAIENAALLEARELAAQKLKEAHEELQRRYDVIRNSADLQESLISALLNGGGLSEIAQRAHEHLRSPVLILDKHLDVKACHPDASAADGVLHAIRVGVSQSTGSETRYKALTSGTLRFAFQSITAGSEQLGWAVLIDPEIEDESAQLAITELVRNRCTPPNKRTSGCARSQRQAGHADLGSAGRARPSATACAPTGQRIERRDS